MENNKVRLQKYLSQAGICSRRKAEEYIERGLVTINGQVATIGQSIDPDTDEVRLNEAIVLETEELLYFKLNKPRGVVTTCKQGSEKSILDVVDIEERVFPIGRLDKDTTGLIILTNDGRLSNYLMHPRYEHEKEYVVEIYGKIEDAELRKMERGVTILWEMTKPAKVMRLSTGRFSITITEGKNRQIRRMVESVGHTVKRLKRIRIENILLGEMEEWEYRALSDKEKKELFARIGIDNSATSK